jgi:hypothetical protein
MNPAKYCLAHYVKAVAAALSRMDGDRTETPN